MLLSVLILVKHKIYLLVQSKATTGNCSDKSTPQKENFWKKGLKISPPSVPSNSNESRFTLTILGHLNYS